MPKNKQNNILNKEQTAEVLTGLTFYEAYLNSGGVHPSLSDSTIRISPFVQYKVRPGQFDSSMLYYSQVTEDLSWIQEKVISNINAARETDH
jgi:hypothetical protein